MKRKTADKKNVRGNWEKEEEGKCTEEWEREEDGGGGHGGGRGVGGVQPLPARRIRYRTEVSNRRLRQSNPKFPEMRTGDRCMME